MMISSRYNTSDLSLPMSSATSSLPWLISQAGSGRNENDVPFYVFAQKQNLIETLRPSTVGSWAFFVPKDVSGSLLEYLVHEKVRSYGVPNFPA